jgi:hypothetical protein
MGFSIRLRPEAATGICEKFHKATGRFTALLRGHPISGRARFSQFSQIVS